MIVTPSTTANLPDRWYLGIDIGTSGISAALLHRGSRCIYPIYWQNIPGTTSSTHSVTPSSEQFRLPALAAVSVPPASNSHPRNMIIHSLSHLSSGDHREFDQEPFRLFIQNFKSLLNTALPYVGNVESTRRGVAIPRSFSSRQDLLQEPVIQWSDHQTIPLVFLQQILQALLTTLNPSTSSGSNACQAVGLEPAVFQTALTELVAVIVGCPGNCADAYQINLREAVLGAGLVSSPEQVFVIEDAIATLLTKFSLDIGRETSTSTDQRAIKISRSKPQWGEGGTLIINVGAGVTELSLVDLPDSLKDLTHDDFSCHTLPYGGNALDQDIICQLILDTIDREQWQQQGYPEFPTFPQPGLPELATRYQLQQWLQSSPWGQVLLTSVPPLKLQLQVQEETQLTLGDWRWTLTRSALERRVLVPFVQQVNRHLNSLLSQVGMSPVAIQQAICTGGGGAWLALGRWLRQKLPSAIITQEPTQLAWGLATVPLYPQLLDTPRHQYNDYFLLAELLNVMGTDSLTVSQITQRLERQGINAHACQSRLRKILSGTLPWGLVPSPTDLIGLAPTSQLNADYQTLTKVPIFSQTGDQYFPIPESRDCLIQYLEKLKIGRYQKLQEPLCQSFEP